ncbi:SAVMC3_10250 family protein [Streptomyces indicus]|uniref:Uncharacterized protein n=1 Tax=Streptomyces indicus TaxID=417292 RepID=A0A1G9JNK7_9ACTN|nr:SAVMC3_10250 family protein [Streptomyces indicus]SDL39089.1 hypothetical protein SAMN05421806_13324 [Streptomyces indicus]
MREFVYVSDGKLSQFVAEPRRFKRTSTVRLNTPVGGFDLEAPTGDTGRDRQRRFQQIDKHLDACAQWFADPEIQPGQWVVFEAPLHCVTLPGDFQHMVLFADPAPGQDPDYEQETGCRLLLHGSTRHLLGYSSATADGAELEGIQSIGASFGIKFLTSAGQAASALSTQHDPVADGAPTPPSQFTGSAVHDLMAVVDRTYGPMSATPWMYGYARVTVVLPATDTTARCVVASPLSVEYAHRQG